MDSGFEWFVNVQKTNQNRWYALLLSDDAKSDEEMIRRWFVWSRWLVWE